jgi:hypothetical protein
VATIESRVALAALASSCIALALLGTVGRAATADAKESPPLTRQLPQLVLGECTKALLASPVRFVCPPLVPVTKYRAFPGLYGHFNGNEGHAKITLLGFNGGDVGPTYWHWVAGLGTRAGMNRWVLSDAQNVVRGKPKFMHVMSLDGRVVRLWRFPPHPAGGQFGGHVVAITRADPWVAVASIHGESAEASARMAVALARRATR